MTECNIQKKPPHWYGVRHTQIILLSFLVAISYGFSVSLSVGIVAMTDPETCPNPDVPAYEWNDQSVILSSFYVGYVIPQVAAGQLAKSYGPKWFLVVTSALGSLLSILTPIAASFGSWAVILCRVLLGFTQGFVYPSVHNLLSKWVPPQERARLGTLVYAGGPLGAVVTMAVTGWLSGTWLGWPCAFYCYGLVGILWTGLYVVFGRNTPNDHGSIDLDEKFYISQGLAQESCSSKTPWKAILTSLRVWAVILAQSAHAWVFTTLFTTVPTYMGGVLEIDIKNIGMLSGVPYLVLWMLSFVFSSIADCAITLKHLKIGLTRKTATTIGFAIPSAALFVLGLINSFQFGDWELIVVLLVIAIGINACAYCGYHVNHMDLSPNHAGTLMGIANSASNLFALFAPLLQQFIVTDHWAIMFYTSSGVYIIGNLVYVLFGSGEAQTWDEPRGCKGGV